MENPVLETGFLAVIAWKWKLEHRLRMIAIQLELFALCHRSISVE
jgi:hypothetical protein